jgi:hypothetical protein
MANMTAITDLLNSKKFLVTLFTMLSAIICKVVLGIDSTTILTTIIIPGGTYVVGQSYSDHGIGAARIAADTGIKMAAINAAAGDERPTVEVTKEILTEVKNA